eukprot:TRINITY_DN17229_c0_g1_i1.p1 TRINITY_DN17229_c0_g1~~TRINITY_DN17229_c0_g1_i1.p1  ORF type:complete len:414 (-),score=113.88 TRINITY_DN17229_c0_g1_i1:67-1308(-)
MIHSLFILNPLGDVLIEKHYRGHIQRTICETFWDELGRGTPENISPVFNTPKYVLVHISRDSLFYLAVLDGEAPPLMVVELLHRIADTFEHYFERVNESILRENFVSVYQLLDEMLDNGIPFTTEPNELVEMIPPPTLVKKVMGGITGSSSVNADLPAGTLTNTPWRKTGVRYATNEVYFDIIEHVDASVDPNGIVTSSEISGEVQSLCKLSGMPDLSLIFSNPHILDDVSFHRCVRISRWEQSKVISFVPPDGSFKLMNYRVKGQLQMPIYVKPQVSFHNGNGKVSVMVGLKNTQGKVVEDTKITIQFPKSVTTANLTSPIGTVSFDDSTKTCRWTIGKIPKDKTPMLEGSVQLQSGVTTPDSMPVISADFKIVMFTVSGLKVDSLSVHNEKYKPYKGVRSVTKAGKFYART